MTTTSTTTLAANPRYKWWVVAMLWLISFFNYADRQAIFSVFPLLEREMQLTPVQLGLLGSAFAWVYGLGAPFAGMIVDRVRRIEPPLKAVVDRLASGEMNPQELHACITKYLEALLFGQYIAEFNRSTRDTA